MRSVRNGRFEPCCDGSGKHPRRLALTDRLFAILNAISHAEIWTDLEAACARRGSRASSIISELPWADALRPAWLVVSCCQSVGIGCYGPSAVARHRPGGSVGVIEIDECAFKRGQRDGRLECNLKQRRIVATFKAWQEAHPEVIAVARGRCGQAPTTGPGLQPLKKAYATACAPPIWPRRSSSFASGLSSKTRLWNRAAATASFLSFGRTLASPRHRSPRVYSFVPPHRPSRLA